MSIQPHDKRERAWRTDLVDSPKARWANVATTAEQVRIAECVGISLMPDDTFLTASARIVDTIADAIGDFPTDVPTAEQKSLAKEIRLDIGSESRRVARVKLKQVIQERRFRENMHALEQMALRPGDVVVHRLDVGKASEEHRDVRKVVSSIRWDGLLFFKGGEGAQAHAKNLKKAESAH